MKKHEFTPEQSENILNVVSDFLSCEGSAYALARHLNEMQNKILLNSIVEVEDPGKGEDEEIINIAPGYMGLVVYRNMLLNDLLFGIEDAVHAEYHAPHVVNAPGK